MSDDPESDWAERAIAAIEAEAAAVARAEADGKTEMTKPKTAAGRARVTNPYYREQVVTLRARLAEALTNLQTSVEQFDALYALHQNIAAEYAALREAGEGIFRDPAEGADPLMDLRAVLDANPAAAQEWEQRIRQDERAKLEQRLAAAITQLARDGWRGVLFDTKAKSGQDGNLAARAILAALRSQAASQPTVRGTYGSGDVDGPEPAASQPAEPVE